jgi:hypothetical protein
MRTLALLLAPLALTGCGGMEGEAPGAVSADEARALNEAAEMLGPNSVSAEALATDNQMDRP